MGDIVEILHPHNRWWECKMVQLLWMTMWQFLNRLNAGILYDVQVPHRESQHVHV